MWHTLSQVTFFSCDKVSKTDGGERDDDKVDGFEGAPAFDVLEDDSRQGHENEAPEQDEEQRGDDSDFRLADFPLLKEQLWREGNRLKNKSQMDLVIWSCWQSRGGR